MIASNDRQSFQHVGWTVLFNLILITLLFTPAAWQISEANGSRISFWLVTWTLVLLVGGMSFYLKRAINWFPRWIAPFWAILMIISPLLISVLDSRLPYVIQLGVGALLIFSLATYLMGSNNALGVTGLGLVLMPSLICGVTLFVLTQLGAQAVGPCHLLSQARRSGCITSIRPIENSMITSTLDSETGELIIFRLYGETIHVEPLKTSWMPVFSKPLRLDYQPNFVEMAPSQQGLIAFEIVSQPIVSDEGVITLGNPLAWETTITKIDLIDWHAEDPFVERLAWPDTASNQELIPSSAVLSPNRRWRVNQTTAGLEVQAVEFKNLRFEGLGDEVFIPTEARYRQFMISNNGEWIVAVSDVFDVYQVSTQEKLATYPKGEWEQEAIAPNGEYFVARVAGSKIDLYFVDTLTGEEIYRLRASTVSTSDFVITADGRYLIVQSPHPHGSFSNEEAGQVYDLGFMEPFLQLE